MYFAKTKHNLDLLGFLFVFSISKSSCERYLYIICVCVYLQNLILIPMISVPHHVKEKDGAVFLYFLIFFNFKPFHISLKQSQIVA